MADERVKAMADAHAQSGSTERSLSDSGMAMELVDLEELSVSATRNPYPHPELKGQDAYLARAEEFPGVVALGASKDDAYERLCELIKHELKYATADQRARLLRLRAHVQFNHRITAADKAEIIARARESGAASVRQFVLDQCLRAPFVKRDRTMPDDKLDSLWARTVRNSRQREQVAGRSTKKNST